MANYYLKTGITMRGLHPSMRPALIAISRILDGLSTNFVIISVTEGSHQASSLHPYGFAIDVRSKSLETDERKQLALKQIKEQLPDFYITLENLGKITEHFHIENQKGFNVYLSNFNRVAQ